MFCGQCGKKVMENMLFCPFCGAAIVIPDQDEASRPSPAETDTAPEAQNEQRPPVRLFDDLKQDTEEEFVPLSFDFDADGPKNAPEPEPAREDTSEIEDVPEDIAPKRGKSERTRRPENTRGRNANTYIPAKDVEPDDLFMSSDGYDDDFDDDYDVDTEDDYAAEDEFEFEESERGNFFQRHIRGIVGSILLLIILLVCVIWFMSPSGQQLLAGWNLAWTAKPYATMAYSAYQSENYDTAASYYERAFSLDSDNYEYAHNALVSYYYAGDIEDATAMARKCIELAPDDETTYVDLKNMYPDADTRPWEISELILQGYERTGNEELNINGE